METHRHIHSLDQNHTALYQDMAHQQTIHRDTGKFEFNGVEISPEVIRQLKMLLGDSLHTMSDHEIDKAHMNFTANGSVIRDENGHDLHDMMHMHWGEEECDKWKISPPEKFEFDEVEEGYETHTHTTPPLSFVERLNPLHMANAAVDWTLRA